MYTNEIEDIGKKCIPGFIGAFPLDRMPSHIGSPPKSFIVNTDTNNLNGKHWLAVSYEQGGIVRAFDPLGFFYPQLLISKLHSHPNVRVHYNRTMIQNPFDQTCGLHCLIFLKSRTDAYKQRILSNN
jgi:hypothetical protein